MPPREKIAAGLHLLGQATVTISSDTTTAYDFGTPNDINCAAITTGQPGALYEHADRVIAVFGAVETAGTTGTDTVSWVVQDAADNGSGSIDTGTLATADTDGTLTGGTGTQYAYTSIKLKSGRPWLRISVDSDGATNTFVTTAQAFGVARVI